MTENEAIKELKDIHKQYVGGTEECEIIAGSITMSIKALEEIQQYRAIGTIEEFKALKEKEERFDRNIRMFNEIGLEIRAKAIDEFAQELLKHQDGNVDTFVWCSDINRIAEQMKAGVKNE